MAGVAFFHKQHGGPTPKAAGRELDGVVWHQYPDGSAVASPAAGETWRLRPSPASGNDSPSMLDDLSPEGRSR
jgi:hypothetical protein